MTDFAPLTLQTPAEHPFAQFVRILGKGKRGARNLTREEAREAMGMCALANIDAHFAEQPLPNSVSELKEGM